MAQDSTHLVWLDLEMTGLDPDTDVILEIFWRKGRYWRYGVILRYWRPWMSGTRAITANPA
jgi:hypothetical protein